MRCHAPWAKGSGRFITRSTRRVTRCIPRTPSRSPAACRRAPIDDLIVFHTVFGKTVPDISLNAVANLGYADGRWLKPVWPGGYAAARKPR